MSKLSMKCYNCGYTWQTTRDAAYYRRLMIKEYGFEINFAGFMDRRLKCPKCGSIRTGLKEASET